MGCLKTFKSTFLFVLKKQVPLLEVIGHLFISLFYFLFIYLFFCLFAISWATPAAYGGSQARGRIGAVAASLCQSHSNWGSEPHLRPTPQLMATPDP